ncbi:hypothetical protein E2562_034424 [Oryza meyeriana var. granulata]|uniref:Growth-regulating factor n=1 Tax=Oryza meyeriana var. granulata TaxID=110450 RepID=A0A6G1BPK8_9ORYZ|nr:hypothetical protein E2562_034424 [Oryza meyeriana var. granulata]
MAMATPTNGSFLLGSGNYPGAQMLSFSSGYSSNAGLDGSSDVTSMQGVLARVKGPFTPTQWMELEHQALIYKHILANAPVPSGLLLPIRRSLHPPVFSHFSSGGILGSSSLGWGSFQLGYSGSADSEPGRCRRTDGKKWRCSRDAVVDQKYCERHINRGRHRSRKHVEGHPSHAMKATVAITQPPIGASNGKLSGSHGVSHELTKTLATNLTDPSPKQFNRMLLDKANLTEHSQEYTNQQHNILQNTEGDNWSEEMSSHADYAVIPSGSLMNTPQSENANLIPQQQHCKQSQPNIVHNLFGKGIQHDDIQLSISIPVDSSNVSTNYNKAQIGHVVGSSSNEGNSTRASWISDSWETSIGGPLGEFFTNTSNASDDKSKSRHPPSLNLLADGHTTSPQLQSPTGVLQMTNFSSVPSSTVSSPGTASAMACSLQAW